MNSVSALFEALEGPTKVAGILSVKTSAASEMKRRGSIPVRYWPDLVAAFGERGIDLSYEDLVRLHSRAA